MRREFSDLLDLEREKRKEKRNLRRTEGKKICTFWRSKRSLSVERSREKDVERPMKKGLVVFALRRGEQLRRCEAKKEMRKFIRMPRLKNPEQVRPPVAKKNSLLLGFFQRKGKGGGLGTQRKRRTSLNRGRKLRNPNRRPRS